MSTGGNAPNTVASEPDPDPAEIAEIEGMLKLFRVQDLKTILNLAHISTSGRKSDMLERALNLIRTKSTPHIRAQVKELHWRVYRQERDQVEANYRAAAANAVPIAQTSNQIQSTSNPIASSSSNSLANQLAQNAATKLLAQTAGIPIFPKVTLTHLPYYDVLEELMKPTTLMPLSELKYQDNHIQFTLPPLMYSRLALTESTPLPRMELQLRFTLMDTMKPQPDEFPSGCVLRMNDKTVTLPNVIPTNKMGVEPKRPSRPVDITAYARRGYGDQRLHISWQTDAKKYWTVSVYLVKHLTASVLMERIREKGERKSNYTIDMVKEKLRSDSADIATTSLRVSLLCPLGKIRMRLPCRLRSCKHLQCFDLELFLQMNEKKPTWTCPVCDKPTFPFDDLQVDEYFLQLLEKTSNDDSEVELYEDGGFKAITDADIPILDDDAELAAAKKGSSFVDAQNTSSPKPQASPAARAPSAGPSKAAPDEIQIIDLISEDEEDNSSSHRSTSSMSSDRSKESGEMQSDVSSPSVVILDTPSPPGSTPEDPKNETETTLAVATVTASAPEKRPSSSPDQKQPPPKKTCWNEGGWYPMQRSTNTYPGYVGRTTQPRPGHLDHPPGYTPQDDQARRYEHFRVMANRQIANFMAGYHHPLVPPRFASYPTFVPSPVPAPTQPQPLFPAMELRNPSPVPPPVQTNGNPIGTTTVRPRDSGAGVQQPSRNANMDSEFADFFKAILPPSQ